MEWVETTGKTIAEATEAALDELGVDEQDAEIVVLEDGRAGFLGFLRSDARVRARVRPAAPRPKRPQRSRRQRREQGPKSADDAGTKTRPSKQPSSDGEAKRNDAAKRSSTPRRAGGGGNRTSEATPSAERSDEETTMTIEQQTESVREFVAGVVERFGYADATTTARVEDGEIFVDVAGEELGLLIGQRGATLDSLQELARTVIQRRTEEHAARVTVDVAGFRARRTAALEAFARRVAGEVVASGSPEALEPMSAADRKIVHDAVTGIEGVLTTSEGVEPRRYVVIRPATTDVPAADEGDAGE